MKKKVEDDFSAEHPVVAKKINNSLNLSLWTGSLSSVSAGLGMSYFSPFALAMNATSAQVGILFAIINLFPSIVQMKASALIRRFSRKKIVLFGLSWKIFLWVPILLTGFLFFLRVRYMVWAFILFVALFYGFGAVTYPAWFSWMGSLVLENKRGEYFSKRNRAAEFFGILAMVVGAVLLDSAKKIGFYYGNVLGFTLLGFGLLFSIAAIIRIWSWELLNRQYEPKIKVRKKDCFSCMDFLKKCTSTPFGKFVLFRGFLSLAVGISGPFLAVYMLRNLDFSYVWYMLVIISVAVFHIVFLPLLGKMSDSFGNVKVVSLCSWLIVTIPLLWFFSSFISDGLLLRFYLLFVPGIIGGFGWAGYNLAVNNYVYDAVSGPKIGFGVAYMNLIVGIGIFIGAIFGSLLAWINISFMNPILFILLVSFAVRFLVVFLGIRFLHEVRHVKKFSSNYLVKEFRPVQGVVREVHYLEHLVKSVEHHAG